MRRTLVLVVLAACGSSARGTPDAAGDDDAPPPDTAAPMTARDRLLADYLAYLQAHPGAQTNGLDGAQLASTCALWGQLQPSAQAVFLTLTARLEGSHLARDGSAMLEHVTHVYWVSGGAGATATDPGACGGAGNRMIMSIDPLLHAELNAASSQQGGAPGARVIDDVIATSFWRDSHDAGGPHAPFDRSDETEGGAPRGQVQFFADPTSAAAMAPLGRPDLMTLVDPHAFEMDQDYDCTHSSNPLCDYTYYGPLCAPRPTQPGVAIYGDSYGAVDLGWQPSGC